VVREADRRLRRRRLNPLDEALAKPKSRVLAIRAKCWDCEGRGADPGWQRRVRECVVESCPLWHLRPYQGSESGTEEIVLKTGEKRGFADLRIDSGEGVETVRAAAGRAR
jgi:hypothetical protein